MKVFLGYFRPISDNRRFLLFLALLFQFIFSYSQDVSIISWNLKDLGRSKSDSEIDLIVDVLKGFDIILVQEVVAKDPAGAQAVAKIGERLKLKGAKWEYRISDPTSGSSPYKTERYAFLWKPSRVKLIGRPFLEVKYRDSIEREPFLATFSFNNREFTLVNFHAITKSAQPEREVKYFKYFPLEYPGKLLIFCGDFNLPQSHTVFNPLKSMGYRSALIGQKTSLRQTCKYNDCLASEFDNIFYPGEKIEKTSAGIVAFYERFAEIKFANLLSDHVPIYFTFKIM